MTTQELDEILVREKQKAEKALGCDMCKKYARCLYCYSRDEFRCAKAHDRLFAAIARGNRKIPSWLLPEPPVEESAAKPRAETVTEKPRAEIHRNKAVYKPEPKVITVKSIINDEAEAGYGERESTEEMIETVAHILSEFNMKTLPEERARELQKISAMMDPAEESSKVLYRTRHLEGDVPILKLTRKNK